MTHYLLIPFLSLFFISSTFSVFAQQETPQEQPALRKDTAPIPIIKDDSFDEDVKKAVSEPDNFQGKFMNMLFILALLIGFMILASIMLKRMTRTRVTQMNNQSLIKVLEARPLSPRSTLYLLDIEGKEILIAESHAGVSHIASFSESGNNKLRSQEPEV
jgi:flagellar biogenesis protein FliO